MRGETRGWRLVLAPRGPVPDSVRRFAKRARRRRLRTLLPLLIGALVVALAAAGAGLAYGTALFGVERIRVLGATVVEPDAVRVAAAVRPGTPLPGLDTGRVRQRVLRLPPVRDAVVERDLPRTLVIRVRERTPVAVVPQPGGSTLIAADGVAYLPVAARPAGLPVVRLRTPGPDDPTTVAALTVLAALPVELRDPTAALVADAPTRIRLELLDGRTVVWGDATENPAKVRVALSQLNTPAAVLDVSAPGVVTVR